VERLLYRVQRRNARSLAVHRAASGPISVIAPRIAQGGVSRLPWCGHPQRALLLEVGAGRDSRAGGHAAPAARPLSGEEGQLSAIVGDRATRPS